MSGKAGTDLTIDVLAILQAIKWREPATLSTLTEARYKAAEQTIRALTEQAA